MNQIYLIGYMGSGKSTIGKLLADRLNYLFIDLDDLIVQRTGYTIDQLFQYYGEEKFRMLESSALHSTFSGEKVVMATGGGAPCFYDNLDQMKSHGIVIYLALEPEKLVDRINKDLVIRRPIVDDKSKEDLLSFIKKHLSSRSQFYDQADRTINSDDNPTNVVSQICEYLDSL